MYLYTFKIGSYHALYRVGSHSGTDGCVVEWFLNMYVPGIPFAKIHDKLSSSVEFVVNQSLHYVIINFQHQIPITNRLVVFL